MIIYIKQRETIISHEFDVYYDKNWRFNLKMGTFSGLQNVYFENPRRELYYTLNFSSDKKFIIDRSVRGEVMCSNIPKDPKGEHRCSIYRDAKNADDFLALSERGEKDIQLYAFADGTTEYSMVFEEGEQIALIEHSLKIYEGCHNYTIYVLPDREQRAEALMFATAYFHACYNHRPFLFERRKNNTVFLLKKYGSKNRAKFDPNWKTKHFKN